jgi:radical SAM superfamily enzyme YgiQ (UPF0313 family)
MNSNSNILILNLPSPPNQRLWRDTAGGFGTAIPSLSKYKADGETPLHPFLPYASSLLLEANYEFKILDCQRLKIDKLQVLAEVKKENPDIIFSILSLPSLKHDFTVLNEIKEAVQNVTIVGVGTVCRVIPNEVLQKSKVDIVMRNSYPYTSHLVDLIQSLQQPRKLKTVGSISYKQNEKIVHVPDTPEPDISDLPAPCYDFLQLDGYETTTDTTGERFLYVPILESKGCPYNCIYCPYPLGFGKKIMFRQPKAIVNEMEYLYSTYNIKGFLLRGQTFAYNRKRATEICEEIIRRKLDVVWFCESRVDEVSRELLNKMKKAGCIRIHYGVETGDPETLKIAKPGVILETTKKAFKTTREIGILTQAHIILGWPDDDHRTLENTRKFILKLEPDVINLNFLTPYPGTKMYDIAKKNSLLLTYDWSNYTSHTVVMQTKTLNANELYAIKKKIIRDFSKQKLRQLLLQQDFPTVKRPRIFINEAKSLVNRIMFPQD